MTLLLSPHTRPPPLHVSVYFPVLSNNPFVTVTAALFLQHMLPLNPSDPTPTLPFIHTVLFFQLSSLLQPDIHANADSCLWSIWHHIPEHLTQNAQISTTSSSIHASHSFKCINWQSTNCSDIFRHHKHKAVYISNPHTYMKNQGKTSEEKYLLPKKL